MRAIARAAPDRDNERPLASRRQIFPPYRGRKAAGDGGQRDIDDVEIIGETCGLWHCRIHGEQAARRLGVRFDRSDTGTFLTCGLPSVREEVSPVGVFGFADGRRNRERLGSRRPPQEPESGFMRQTVGLTGVDLLLGPHEVLE